MAREIKSIGNHRVNSQRLMNDGGIPQAICCREQNSRGLRRDQTVRLVVWLMTDCLVADELVCKCDD
eukprot:scaffold39165_cov20-Prasinocladus_malaysianus.AAC.1